MTASDSQSRLQRPRALTWSSDPRWADRVVMRRSIHGAAVLPIGLALVGLAGDSPSEQPRVFWGSMAALLLLGIARVAVVRRARRASPSRQALLRRLFDLNLILGSLILGLACASVISRRGLGSEAALALIAPAMIASVAVIVYNPTPWLVRFQVLASSLPPLLALGASDDPKAWVLIASAMFYLPLLDRLLLRLHREVLRVRDRQKKLADYAVDLEQAHQDLGRSQEKLEAEVARRTEQLQVREEEYRSIFENAHDAILVLDPKDEKILKANRRAGEIYGVPVEELVGRSVIDFSTEVERGRRKVESTLESGHMIQFETVQVRADGREMTLEVNASVIAYRGEKVIVSINRDVTERKQAESLRLAKELAERSNEAKSRFLANMSHEVRTPMNGVLGLASLLLSAELPAPQRHQLELLHQSAEGLLRILDDVLDFSRIEAGKLEVRKTPFALRAVAHGVVELLDPRARAKGLELHLETDPNLPPYVRGDRARLRQVLINLIDNGVKFTERGGVTLSVGRPTTGTGIHFRIRDTGIGIPEEEVDRIFTPFHQIDDSMSRQVGGTGLGLAICNQLVGLMGGTLQTESAVGRGTVLSFTLPLERVADHEIPKSAVSESDDSDDPDTEGEPPAESGNELPAIKRGRVLVAEDNRVNQYVIASVLEKLGLEVEVVADGRAAVERVRQGDLDLVLMDCQMPDLDGYEASRRIRTLEGRPADTPIIALTAHAMGGDRERCLAAGMDGYLAKPFDHAKLSMLVDQALEGGRGALSLALKREESGQVPRIDPPNTEPTPPSAAGSSAEAS